MHVIVKQSSGGGQCLGSLLRECHTPTKSSLSQEISHRNEEFFGQIEDLTRVVILYERFI